jgi:hypothetical protein
MAGLFSGRAAAAGGGGAGQRRQTAEQRQQRWHKVGGAGSGCSAVIAFKHQLPLVSMHSAFLLNRRTCQQPWHVTCHAVL